jgi:hypothetical protein
VVASLGRSQQMMVKLGVLPCGKATRAHDRLAITYSLLRTNESQLSIGKLSL